MQIWYPASKTLAEKAAWDFAKKTGLDVVAINPGTVMGPIIPPAINASMAMLLKFLQGMCVLYFVPLELVHEDFILGFLASYTLNPLLRF